MNPGTFVSHTDRCKGIQTAGVARQKGYRGMGVCGWGSGAVLSEHPEDIRTWLKS